MSKIITEDDLKREIQDERCREALRVMDCPENIVRKYSGPLLWQFAHMAVFLEMGWRLALSWVEQNKALIFARAEGKIDEYGNITHEQIAAAASKTNRSSD